MRNNIILSSYDDIKNPHYGGGGAIAMHEIAKSLKKNADVVFISWNHSGKKIEVIDGITYQRIGHPSVPPKLGMIVFQVLLPLLAMTKKYSVWLESFGPPFTTAMLPLFTKKKIVGIVHMLAASDMERKYKLPFHLIESFGIKKYSHIITTSQGMKDEIQKINHHAVISVIGNGVRPVPSKSLSKKDQILFLGRIEVDQKGIDFLLQAFTLFSQKNKTTKLIIAGSGLPKEEKKLQELVNSSGLNERINLVGRVTGNAKDRLMRESRFIVIPSRFETYSLTALEAMAYGTPIICFAIPGLTWIPSVAAVKVAPFNIEQMAAAFHQLINNRVKMVKLGSLGKKYAKTFSWETIGSEYSKYIRSIS